MPTPISVSIITFNEERNIGRCLASVAGVADEILVVDSLSTDRTREISAEMGARVVEQPFLGYVEQKNFALDHCTHDHVLALDADEALSPELTRSVEQAKLDWSHDGYTMNRFNNYYGTWIHHSGVYPDRKLRLWNRTRGRWGGKNPHDKVGMQPGSTVRRLEGDLLHYAYASMHDHAHQANRFSTIAADAYLRAGKRSNVFRTVANPAVRFTMDYVVKGGFRDGFAGFMVCSINAYMTFLKYAKLRQLQRDSRS